MQGKTCLFCLEDVKQEEQIRNLIGCECELLAHQSCMQNWFETKHQLECPVCHAVSLPNYMFQREGPQVIHIIHVDPLHAREAAAELERRRWQEKCAGWCCLTLLFWGIFANVISYF